MKKWIAKNWLIAIPAAIVAGIMVGALAIGTGIVSADHYDYGDDNRQCHYSYMVNSGDYNVEVQITEDERGYYFEMDGDARVTTLASDRYRIHFTEANAGERHTFYAQAHTSGHDNYSFCERHGAFPRQARIRRTPCPS